MRVLYIARYYTPMMHRKLAFMAAEPGLELWLLRPGWWRDEYGRRRILALADNYHLIEVPLVGKPNNPHWTFYRTLSFSLPKVKPDLIHVEEEPDSLAALQFLLLRSVFCSSTPVILHTWQNINRPKRWYVWQVTRFSLRQSTAILCANQEAVQVLTAMGYHGIMAVLPPQGVDVEIFHPVGIHPDPAHFTIGYAGRLVPEKSVETLLSALAAMPPSARLWIIGDGPCRRMLQSQTEQWGISDRVQFVAPVPATQMPTLLAQLDVLVLPSRTTPLWKEQFGRVLIEAMACQVPVVGSDSGAIPEVIGDAGLIFPEGDVAALTACLQELQKNPDLRRDLAARGYQWVHQHFTQERVAAATLAFYRRLLHEPLP